MASHLGAPVPVLRVQDWLVAETFYVDYLGFTTQWLHRFDDEAPAYVRVSRDATLLDLSEHHGDGTPGSVVWIPVADIVAFHRDISGRGHPRVRPGIEDDAPGGPTLSVTDPFGNVLRFCEADEDGD